MGPLNMAKKLFLLTFDYVIYYYCMVDWLTYYPFDSLYILLEDMAISE